MSGWDCLVKKWHGANDAGTSEGARKAALTRGMSLAQHGEFYKSKGLQTFSHGRNHVGAVNKSETNFTPAQAHAHLSETGYRKIREHTGLGGLRYHSYEGESPGMGWENRAHIAVKGGKIHSIEHAHHFTD